jgi:catechol 2,3-dioxygenase-like lactoylglutathione lyase family enzyme
MLESADFVGFIPVSDLATAREFYVDRLGLTLVHEDQFALVVRANATTLRLTPVVDLRPQPFTIAGWTSKNVASLVAKLRDAGVRFNRYEGLDQDELDIWHAPGGDLVAWFCDLDGNILSISGHTEP